MMQRKTMTTINIRQIQIKKYIYESKSDFWTKKLKNLVESTFLKIANTLMCRISQHVLDEKFY